MNLLPCFYRKRESPNTQSLHTGTKKGSGINGGYVRWQNATQKIKTKKTWRVFMPNTFFLQDVLALLSRPL
ncbi:hypothetical protein CLV99_4269 [Sphingobacterium yanglingense]|uniref:Uncharacterized protein n=1 Tax=Sphingobacterium yanglingense TaxID=1437280 RepID=A0A4R6W8V7_9SPHI|nr:hypothetical protein CLV99_4269 [Sphingobacterium yanglingense]